MNMTSLTVLAPAKINLALNITGRREDGYHLLDSLFAFCGLADVLQLAPADSLTLDVSGPWGNQIESNDTNLVLKAAHLLQETTGIAAGARLSLAKHIPVAAGLGGGSADAAAALRGLNSLWQCELSGEQFNTLAALLGADVPACMSSQPVLARGIGDVLTALPPLPACGVLLVNPRAETPTPAVFKAFAKANPVIVERSLASLEQRFDSIEALVAALRPRGNDLLHAATQVTPVIADVLDVLHGLPQCRYAHLSGSGATCFALFASEKLAAEAAQAMNDLKPDWWNWSGSLAKPDGQ